MQFPKRTWGTNEWDLRLISLGAGVQSSALLLLAINGEIPKPDGAVFADTQGEPRLVYRHLKRLQKMADKAEIPIYIGTAGNLKQDYIDFVSYKRKRMGTIPFFTKNESGKKGILPRHCTRDYKIDVIKREARRILGVKSGRGKRIESWIGISTDELERVSTPREQYLTNYYPLIEFGMSRKDCQDYLEQNGLQDVPRSACTFCPYHGNEYWRWLRDTSPEDFQDAIEMDRKIRVIPYIESKAYLHPDCIPLEQVQLDKNDGVVELQGECEGMCGL